MNKLVINNLLHRPLRTAISVFAVAIEVVMILSIAAIMLGMLNGNKSRTSGIGMDMIVSPPNTTFLTGVSGAPASIKVADILRKLPHVEVVAPVIVQLTAASSVENIYGIDFESFNALRPFVFVSGAKFHQPFDVIVDDMFARSDKGHQVGDTIRILNHDWRISGIVEHGKGGRKFISIQTMGQVLGAENKASTFYLKVDDLKNESAIRSEIKNVPGMSDYQVQTLDELLSSITPEHMPGFKPALSTVIGIAIIIGFLVIFQSMYTAVMERTREIGILKSLGASRGYIVGVVLRETAFVAVIGILLGVELTFGIRALLHFRFPTMDFLVTQYWLIQGAMIAFVGAMLGAVYPALKAAHKDPIDALAYE